MSTTSCTNPNDPCYLLGPEDTSDDNCSSHFTVGEAGKMALINAYHLMAGDVVTLQHVIGDSTGGYSYEDAYFVNRLPMALEPGLTSLPVLLPGTYRVCVEPASAVDRILVRCQHVDKDCLKNLPFVDMLIGVPPTEYTNTCPGYENVETYAEALDIVIAEVKALSAVTLVTSITQTPNGDYLVTYNNGTSELLDDFDIPTFGVGTNIDGTINLLWNGLQVASNIAIGPHTVDTNTTYEFKIQPDGSVIICDDQGNVLAQTGSQVVDTDTFSTPVFNAVDGTVTVFYANGQSYTFDTGPHTVDTFGTVTDNGDNTYTWTPPTGPAGAVTWSAAVEVHMGSTEPTNGEVIWIDCDQGKAFYWCEPYWVSYNLEAGLEDVSADAATASLDIGFGAGLVNKPVGAPAALADVQNANEQLGVSYPSMLEFFTNAAANSFNNKIGGMMNENGSLGYHSPYLLFPTGATQQADINAAFGGYNGAHLQVSIDEGDTLTLPAGYRGQRMTVTFTNNQAQTQVVTADVTVGLVGGNILRDTTNVIRTMGNGNQTVQVRASERWEMVSIGFFGWKILSNFRPAAGPGWRENPDGTVSMNFRAALGGTGNQVTAVTLPVQVTNPGAMIVNVTDYGNDAVADGDPNPAGRGIFSYVHYGNSSTTTTAMIGAVDPAGGASGVGNVEIQIEGALVDVSTI